jgi:hypothetical protein
MRLCLSRLAALIASLAAAGLAQAADPQLGPAGAPPGELSSDLRGALAAGGHQVSSDGQALAELWLRTELPAAGQAGSRMGVSFGQIPESTLVGVVRLPQVWTDYKGEAVAAGVYTLRYALQPADGNHMGVTLYRDFLVLAPAADDPGPDATLDAAQLVALGRKASGTNHPASMAVFPVPDGTAAPALAKNEMDQWTLAAAAGGVTLGLVVLGHAEVEGY